MSTASANAGNGGVVTLPAYDPVPVVDPVVGDTPGYAQVTDLTGDTILNCGPNQDFVLFQHDSGFDLVLGFDPSDTGDVIAIEANVNGTGLETFEQLDIQDTEVGALVNLGANDSFLLVGVSLEQLDSTDIYIHPEISPVPEEDLPVVQYPADMPPLCGTILPGEDCPGIAF
jgi:hypothetical protein